MSLLMMRPAILAQGAAGSEPPAHLEVRISALRATTILSRKGVWTSALRCTVIFKET